MCEVFTLFKLEDLSNEYCGEKETSFKCLMKNVKYKVNR